MFDSLKNFWRKSAEPVAYTFYAIGDVHGYSDAFGHMLERMHEHQYKNPARETKLIILGDLVDRGSDSRGALELAVQEKKYCEENGIDFVALKGNHEYGFLEFLTRQIDDTKDLPSEITFFLDKGGLNTLASYGVRVKSASPFQSEHIHHVEGCHLRVGAKEILEAQREILQEIPIAHLELLKGMPTSFATEKFLFCHAGVDPRSRLEKQNDDVLMGLGRDMFSQCNEKLEKIVVHGHIITRRPHVNKAQIGIDTGIYKTGHLAGAILTADKVSFLRTLTSFPKYDRTIQPGSSPSPTQ